MEILHTAEFESPIGLLRVASSRKGLAYLELPHAHGRGLMGWKRRHAPGATIVPDERPNRHCISQILEFLTGGRQDFDLPLDLRGTPFQLKVYEDVASIPYGGCRSYGEVARRVGSPRAWRAVGAANGANPVPLVVPCHRVIGSGGKLQGYAGGLETKAKLLAMERSGPAEGRLF